MSYTPSFNPAYAQWHDEPTQDTPVTAAVMENYDTAIENIETFLDGSTAVKPVSKTGLMTKNVGVDENGALWTAPLDGSETIGASGVTYDNTDSGMTATDVQAAIDELAAGAGSPVNPTAKTEDMTQAVGVDSDGLLWTAPGGGGANVITALDTIVEGAQISDTSDYKTANLEKNPFGYKLLMVTVRNTSASCATNVFVEHIPESGRISLNANGIVGSGNVVTVALTSSTIEGVNYSGSYQNLWVDIYGIKEIEGGEATDISYDNTTSGLTTTNVQNAIDEIDGLIDSPDEVNTLSDSDYIYLNISGVMKKITLANLKTVLGI